MRIQKLILCGTITMAMAVSMALAQTNRVPETGTIAQRKQNQQDRVANGIQSGQLTAGETKNLERREANLNGNERRMRAADGGKLSAADRTQLNRQENHISGKIYEDKHNARTAAYGKGEIGQRRENQQDRIAQGIRSGQMRPGGAANQEASEQRLNRQISADRQADGGRLTAANRQAISQQQNRESRQIYNKKHNAATGY